MQQYLDLMTRVMQEGTLKKDRTGTGTKSIFGHQMRFDLSKGFPCVTTKKIHLKSIIHELLWFLKGDTNIKYLKENGVRIWDEWADENGDLGNIYGYQWRSWPAPDGAHIDQITKVIEALKNTPDRRRIIVSAWNVGEIEQMALPPCHAVFQFYVADKKLSCQIYQRSADIFLGLPFNITSYALLTYMVAHQTKMKPAKLIWIGGDCHLYKNHIQQAKIQLNRKPFEAPTLSFKSDIKDIFSYQSSDFNIVNYKYHETIKAPIAV